MFSYLNAHRSKGCESRTWSLTHHCPALRSTIHLSHYAQISRNPAILRAPLLQVRVSEAEVTETSSSQMVDEFYEPPEMDSGIGCPEDSSEQLKDVREYGSTLTLLQYLGLSALAMVVGYASHPMLLKVTAVTWGVRPTDSNFETSFFGLLSVVYSVFTGQTFLFLYERQMNIVQETYGEVFALELLVQQMFISCNDPEYRALMAIAVRQYMKEEVYNPSDAKSPFTCEGTFMGILNILVAMQSQGIPVQGIVEACKQLADAQSRRSAVAASILPVVHWIFMHGMELIFIATFLVFDASEVDASDWSAPLQVPVERSLFFGALFGVLALNTQVLKDLDCPVTGLYAFRGSLDDRVAFLTTLLRELATKPGNYVPSSVLTLEALGLIATPRSNGINDEEGLNTTLSVQQMARRSRGRRQRTMPGGKWGSPDGRW